MPLPVGSWWIEPALFFDGERLRRDVRLKIEDARVRAVVPAGIAVQDGAPCWQTEYMACPAFVDLQVNGGGGVLFAQEPTPAGLRAIAAAHRRGGTGSWFPTLITSTSDVMEMAVEAVLSVYGQYGVAGMHIEGPHIAAAFRGRMP